MSRERESTRALLTNVPTNPTTPYGEKQVRTLNKWLNNLDVIADAKARARAVVLYAGTPVTLYDCRDGKITSADIYKITGEPDAFKKWQAPYERESILNQRLQREARRKIRRGR